MTGDVACCPSASVLKSSPSYIRYFLKDLIGYIFKLLELNPHHDARRPLLLRLANGWVFVKCHNLDGGHSLQRPARLQGPLEYA